MSKYVNPYRIEWTSFENGERMPFLVKAETGLPLQEPTFWVVASRRPLGVQPNTLANDLRSLVYLFLWSDLRGINVQERILNGRFLTLSEILDLVNLCGRFVDAILTELHVETGNVVALPVPEAASVRAGERRNRLAAIHRYLSFTSADCLSELQGTPAWDRHNAMRKQFLDTLAGYRDALVVPKSAKIFGKEGLAKAVLRRLLEVIEPDHPDNPFIKEVRFRNFVIVRLLIELGMRRGELLGLKVSDCSFGSEAAFITIHRRPDDPDDPRHNKPSTKTEARLLELGDRLSDILHRWIVEHRRTYTNARRHDFLIVSTPDGDPMSLDNVNKIFASLRRKVSGLTHVTPHVLRHTWNDLFSETADRKGFSPDDEVTWRAHSMGWRDKDSAKHYLARTVRARSNEVVREIQDNLTLPDKAE
ncbi:site-specific integrase [Rhizobium sp. BJ04]|uniref:tyrosine-type recombinase/integrase n=1 Tax=Rhizobium binxianense TaxID=3024242 RepID=UPI0023A9DCFE|nr:site-specific integrase [Rhizobium sp. BJ04]WEA59539.1 site-specific integrase [Rhizobium sp. BJ04]